MAAEPARRPRGIGYARKSPKGGGAEAKYYEDVSLEYQERAIRELCEREGIDLGAVRHERHVRHDLKARRVLMGILEECRQGLWDVVVPYDPTRWCGDPDDSAWLRVEVRDAGATLRFVRDDPGQGDDGALLGYVKGYSSRKETGGLIARAAEGKRDRLEQKGKPLPHPAPYGYRWNHEVDPASAPRKADRFSRLHVDEDEAPVVRRLFAQADAGQSSAALARGLNAEGVPGPRGPVWRQGSVARVLRNEAYLGHQAVYKTRRAVVGRGESVRRVQAPQTPETWFWLRDQHPPLVDELTFERVGRRLAQARSAPRPRAPDAAPGAGHGPRYLLTQGLAVCAGCEAPMVGRTSTGLKHDARGVFAPGESTRYYACPTTNTSVREAVLAGRRPACPAPGYIRADVLDRLAWGKVVAAGVLPPAPRPPDDAGARDRELGRLLRHETRLDRRLQEGTRRLLDAGPEQRAALEAVNAATVLELRTVRAERDALRDAGRREETERESWSGLLRLLTAHADRFQACLPWGPDAGQDEEMRAVLRALRARARVRRYADLAEGEVWAEVTLLGASPGATVHSLETRSSSATTLRDMATRLRTALA